MKRARILASEMEKGQSLVELAVSIVMIMTLLAGAVDLGRMFFSYVVILDASQEGAVYAAIEPGDSNAIEARARASSNAPIDLENDPNVGFAISPVLVADRCAGDQVTVTVSYIYNFTMPLATTFIPSGAVTLNATTTSIVLRDDC